MRIAIVHDWLTGMRGGEKVLSLICQLFPQADLLTLIHTANRLDRHIDRMKIVTSFLNELPAVGKYYRYLLPIMPMAIEQMNARDYDLIVSCSHCVAKGIVRAPGSLHVCYCFTPMRYIWDGADSYRRSMGLTGRALGSVTEYLRAWDLRSAKHVDLFMTTSNAVADRIRLRYQRDAVVIPAPIDPEFYTPVDCPREDFYFMVTALVPYKRVDHAIEACKRLGRPLRVIGSGPDMERLKHNLPSNIQLMGWQNDQVVRECYRRCRAFLMPADEDFGLTPIEAMACGTPVIAYGKGGALDTIMDFDATGAYDATGILYTPQTVDGLMSAIERFEKIHDRFDRCRLVSWARRFTPDRFTEEFKSALRPLLAGKGLEEPWLNATTI